MSKAQIKFIWGAAARLHLDKYQVYDILNKEVNKDSMTKCTDSELGRVVEYLKLLELCMDGNGSPAGRLTNKQLWKINDYAKKLGWNDNPKRLQAFVKKYYGVEKAEWLTFTDAEKCIESLKKVYWRSKSKKKTSNG